MSTASICAVLETDLFTRLKKEDEEFLVDTMEAFDTRRQSLIQKVRESNGKLITDYTEKFSEKIGRVFKVRKDMIKKWWEKIGKERRELVDKYRDSLRRENLKRLEMLELPEASTAELYDKLDDVVK